jgi:hypothetical protein
MAKPRVRDLDGLTIAAIAIVAYCAASLVHEGLGHGGACLLLGGRPQSLNAIFFSYDEASVSNAARLVIAMAGTVANLVFGCLAALLLARWRHAAATARFFLWLFCAVNLLQAAGYLFFSGVAGVGDWAAVVAPLRAPIASRIGLTVVGGLLYFVTVARFLERRLEPFMAPGPRGGGRLGRLVRLPYVVGGVTLTATGLFNPHGLELVLISAAAASFGGTSLLVWYPFRRRAGLAGDGVPLSIPRSPAWVLAGALTLVVFVVVFGPGIGAPR